MATAKKRKTQATDWQLTARDGMNPRVLTVQHDMTVWKLALFLDENQISGAPVLDVLIRTVGLRRD